MDRAALEELLRKSDEEIATLHIEAHRQIEERATPYNRPIPQHTIQRSAAQDPTAALLTTGGSLRLNDSDRDGLNEWFKSSFKNQFKYKISWFCHDWFPEFFAPMRDRINANFNKAFDLIRKHDEEVATLRREMKSEANKIRREIESRPIIELSGENLAIVRDDLLKILRKDLGIERGEVIDMPKSQVRK